MRILQWKSGQFGSLPPLFRSVAWLMVWTFATSTGHAENYVVGFAQDTLSNDWRSAQVEAVGRELGKHPGITFVVKDAEGSTALQIMQIEDLVASGVDVLVTSPRERDPLTPVIRRVYRSGIPVVLLSRSIRGDSYTTFVRPDNVSIARAAGKLILDALGAKGTVLMLEGVQGASTSLQRTEGFMAVVSPYPEIRVIRKVANYLRADAIFAVEAVLAEGETIDAIYAQSDSMAAGARMALRRAGIDPGSIPTVGIDYIAEARQAIRKGEQVASFTYETGGREGARLVVDLLHGKSVPKSVVLESIEVTKDNVDLIDPIF
jgi:ribose transport system substrate-binding protein